MPDDTPATTAPLAPGPDIQVWPLARILREVAVGSGDWTWEEEWADLDQRHAATGYLDTLEKKIRNNGITMPVVIGNDGRLWDGHHRLRIAVRAGIDYVPVEIVPPALLADPELTADEARDAIAFTRERCDLADREGTPVTTTNVREWLNGPRPGQRVSFPPPRATPARDEYEQATGHEITCAAGFADTCTCGTAGRTETGARLRTCDATHTGGAQHPITLGPCTLQRGHDTHQDASGDAWYSPGPADALRELRERAEQAEAAVARVRAVCDKPLPLARLEHRDEPSDEERGWANAMAAVEAALEATGGASKLDQLLTTYRAQRPPAPAHLATCRRMETRTCPTSYDGPCGDRPCARFESDDTTPWENQ